MFNDKYGLTQAVLEGRKTQTRRTFLKCGEESLLHGITPEYLISVRSRYLLGETIAIAQKYEDLIKNDEFYRLCGKNGMPLECIKYERGCNNKMFVRADLMPHHIRITKIRMERLQDISDEDCLKEGICRSDIKNTLWGVAPIRGEGESGTTYEHSVLGYGPWHLFPSVKRAYASLIDRISGKGTFESNPYVFVYDFELID
nr:MAG TPA: ASCH domain protein [Caudoviricetes sp.]